MSNNDFNTDLKRSDEINTPIVCKILKKLGYETVSTNDDNKHDIIIEKNNKTFHLELKEDLESEISGNVYVEYESYGKPSGILSTKADFYLYTVYYKQFSNIKGHYKLLVTPVETLRKFLIDNAHKYATGVRGGEIDRKTGEKADLGHLMAIPVFEEGNHIIYDSHLNKGYNSNYFFDELKNNMKCLIR